MVCPLASANNPRTKSGHNVCSSVRFPRGVDGRTLFVGWLYWVCCPIDAFMREINMRSDLSEIKRRIDALEHLAHSLHDSDTSRIAESQRDAAGFMALYVIVQEIAARYGVSDAEFFRHWEIRRRYFYDYYIAQTARISPELASAIDERSPNAVPPKKGFPPLFQQ